MVCTQETQVALLDDKSYAVVERLLDLEHLAVLTGGRTPIKLKTGGGMRRPPDYWLPTEFEQNVRLLQERGVLVS